MQEGMAILLEGTRRVMHKGENENEFKQFPTWGPTQKGSIHQQSNRETL